MGLLGSVLVRLIAAVPPDTVLPPIIGGHASLNLFTAVVDHSGGGKGGAEAAAADRAVMINDRITEEATKRAGRTIMRRLDMRSWHEVEGWKFPPLPATNGRTGRILNISMLIEAGLIHAPILYMSRFINVHKHDYYELLSGVTRDSAWEPWIIYMLEAVRRTADSTAAKIAAIRTVQAELHDQARSASPGGRNADFLAVLFEQPYSRIQIVARRCRVSRQTAASWLTDLASSGILIDYKVGRDRLFLNERFLDVLVRNELEEASKPTFAA